MAVNQAVHFTDWVIGHSHLAMLGFATFRRGRRPGARVAAHRRGRATTRARSTGRYWLLTAGVVMMVVDLTIAGLVEARLWQSGAPWIESVQAARPYWVVRALSGVPLAAGLRRAAAGPDDGPARRGAARSNEHRRRARRRDRAPPGARGRGGGVVSPQPRRALRMSYLVASVAGVAFFVHVGGAARRVARPRARASRRGRWRRSTCWR